MLVLLPPSETKAPDGEGPPLDLAALSAPELARGADFVEEAGQLLDLAVALEVANKGDHRARLSAYPLTDQERGKAAGRGVR